MEDSKNALFVEPNAYINHFNKKDKCEVKPIKKVVFSEPYDCMPNFYFNNHFEKGDCDCVSNVHQQNCKCNDKNINKNHSCDCNQNHDCNCSQNHNCKNHNKSNFGFDIKNLMPILSGLNKGGSGIDFNSISSLFSGNGGFDFSKLLSNPDLIKMAMSLFSGKNKKTKPKEEIICTDYEIKRYTKVD